MTHRPTEKLGLTFEYKLSLITTDVYCLNNNNNNFKDLDLNYLINNNRNLLFTNRNLKIGKFGLLRTFHAFDIYDL